MVQKPSHSSSELLYRGIGGSPGLASGRAKIIELVNQTEGSIPDKVIGDEAVNPGDIVILPDLYAGGGPLLEIVDGLITYDDSEGIAGHSATAARCKEVPAVVDCPDPRSTIEQGELITIDGDFGTVYRGVGWF